MIVFLDTPLLIDYIENRDREIAHFVQNLIDSEKIQVSTSIYNIIELLDKIQEIRHMGKLLLKKYSFDEIVRNRRKKLSKTEREDILKEIGEFRDKLIIFQIDTDKGYQKVIDLLAEIDLKSQDALIVGCFDASEARMFLTKDSELVSNIKVKIKEVYDVKNKLKEVKKKLKIK
jgi:predicted nucleic acid-binding protein